MSVKGIFCCAARAGWNKSNSKYALGLGGGGGGGGTTKNTFD